MPSYTDPEQARLLPASAQHAGGRGSSSSNDSLSNDMDRTLIVNGSEEESIGITPPRHGPRRTADGKSCRGSGPSGTVGAGSSSSGGGGGGGGSENGGRGCRNCPCAHAEPHFGGAEIIRDIIVGLADGLTVPFALAAGLSSFDDSRIVVTAGLAEIAAGTISMGLGGLLAGMSEIEHYDSERLREKLEVETMPDREEEEIYEIFEPYHISRQAVQPILTQLRANPEKWIDFMMKFELCLERPSINRSWISALTIGLSYLVGGFVPLSPYFFIPKARDALYYSAAVTLMTLFAFGYTKSRVMGTPRPLYNGLQMLFVGSLAAFTAFQVARIFPQSEPTGSP